MPVTPETYPNTSVFINKLGLTSPGALTAAETDFSVLQHEIYRTNPLSATFDLAHLQAIHQQLFGDIYEWAGKLRGYDIRKGICEFTPYQQIEHYAEQVYAELRQENYLRHLSLQAIIPRIAYYYDLTNRLHPFPEGNGRTQRLFIEHLAAFAGFKTDWGNTFPWQVIEIAEQSFRGSIDPTVLLFAEITSPILAEVSGTIEPLAKLQTQGKYQWLTVMHRV